jgi:hypothetical protein
MEERGAHFGKIAVAILGIAGIVCDRSELLAIITTILAAALVLLNVETYLRLLS